MFSEVLPKPKLISSSASASTIKTSIIPKTAAWQCGLKSYAPNNPVKLVKVNQSL